MACRKSSCLELENLSDYADVVSTLIGIFARVAGVDEPTLYRDLVTADRDVIRMRAADSDDGTVSMNEGVDFVRGAGEIVLAAACSYYKPQPLFRAGANREARAYLRQMRLGQTDHGSFVVTLLSPVVPPPMQLTLGLSVPKSFRTTREERRITKHLAGSLKAARRAIEGTVGGESDAFAEVVEKGVSANLCEALDRMIHALLNNRRQFRLGAHAPNAKSAPSHPFLQRRRAYIAGGGARLSKTGPAP